MRIVSLMVVVLMWSGPPLSARGAAPTPFALGPQGGVLVAVMVNGTGPHRFLFDTGASHSSISDQLARRVEAGAVARTMVSTPTGDRERLVVQVERIAVGPIVAAAAATAVPAIDLTLAGDVAGVLGQDVLAGLSYTIDYRRRQIRWGDQRDLDGGRSIAVVPLVFHDGLPMVELRQDDATLRLVADSGAGGLVLFEGDGPALPGVIPDGGRVRLETFHGSNLARSARVGRFRVGQSTFHDWPAVLLKRPPAPGNGSDGLLPLHMFSQVTFDGPAGRLILG